MNPSQGDPLTPSTPRAANNNRPFIKDELFGSGRSAQNRTFYEHCVCDLWAQFVCAWVRTPCECRVSECSKVSNKPLDQNDWKRAQYLGDSVCHGYTPLVHTEYNKNNMNEISQVRVQFQITKLLVPNQETAMECVWSTVIWCANIRTIWIDAMLAV